MEKYYPIGTIVRLHNGRKKLMITGFSCSEGKKDSLIFDYCGCPYPEGYLTSDRVFLFNNNQIEEVVYLGYSDEEEKAFKEILRSAKQAGEKFVEN